MPDIAEVWLWDRKVGEVSSEGATVRFEFESDFAGSGFEISPLRMSSSADAAYVFSPAAMKSFKSLPPCLSDSLPDDFGNAVLNAWFRLNGRDPEQVSAVERLLCIGARGMGALEFRPAHPIAPSFDSKLKLEPLVKLAATMCSSTQFGCEVSRTSLSIDEQTTLEHLVQIGVLAGGQRAKAVVLFDEERETVVAGDASPAAAMGHWLLKFDIGAGPDGHPAGFGRVEYAYYLMALAARITMGDSRLHLDGSRAHFMTRRFDRVEGFKKIHVQSLAAMDQADYTKPGSYSYEQALIACQRLHLSVEDQTELYRRAVFNVLARNQDDHTRNIAFCMTRDGNWSLSPAYDLTWAYREDSPWVSAHQMTIGRKRDHFTVDDLLTFARLIPGADGAAIIKEVSESVGRWRDFAVAAGVEDASLIERIEQTHRLQLAKNL